MRQKQTVEIAAGGGMAHDEIAVALGITTAQLRERFAKELSVGAHRQRMRVMVALFEQAKIGNVAAAKAYMANEARLAAPPLPKELQPEPGRKQKPGKKAQRIADAQDAEKGTDWEGLLGRRVPGPATKQ